MLTGSRDFFRCSGIKVLRRESCVFFCHKFTLATTGLACAQQPGEHKRFKAFKNGDFVT